MEGFYRILLLLWSIDNCIFDFFWWSVNMFVVLRQCVVLSWKRPTKYGLFWVWPYAVTGSGTTVSTTLRYHTLYHIQKQNIAMFYRK